MQVLIGDMFESKAKTLVNTVNCVGVMGKGIAKMFKDRYPDMFRDYKWRCDAGLVHPGQPYLFEDLLGTSILNFPTKDHWRSSSRISYVEDGLDWFVDNWKKLGLESVAFPPLGCGNGGLEWQDVGPLMYSKLSDLPIEIEVYAPYGTPQSQLQPEFLLQKKPEVGVAVGHMNRRYVRQWELILQAIRMVNADRYATTVGRTVYQKVCYAMQRCGVDLQFSFIRGEYGPYSKQANEALKALANKNYVVERTKGSMNAIDASPQFVFDRGKFSAKEIEALCTVVDLFCRIRDTAQAERVATLLYAYDNVVGCNPAPAEDVLADSVISYITEWKPRWNNEADINKLRTDLAGLDLIGWVTVDCYPDGDLNAF